MCLEVTPRDMGNRKDTFAHGEWYHCYTRSIDGKSTFNTPADYKRFIEALYLSNDTKRTERGNLKRSSYEDILALPRQEMIVTIGAYCLMPNHFHLLVKEVHDGGITQFMRRVGTSYAMYFNKKYGRIGNVFVKPFRSKHISDDRYLTRIAEYIHLNPAELFESKWKSGAPLSLATLHNQLLEYPYSSLPEFADVKRPEHVLTSGDLEYLKFSERNLSLSELLSERKEYYANLPV